MKVIEKDGKTFFIVPETKTIVGTMYRKDWAAYKDFSETNDKIAWIIKDSTDLLDNHKRVNSVAICKDSDEYDEKIGMDICSSKLELKSHKSISNAYEVAYRRLQEAANKAFDLHCKHLNKEIAIKQDLNDYYGGEAE